MIPNPNATLKAASSGLPEFAGAQRNGLPRAMAGDSISRQNGYIHRALQEAEQRGGEPSVLRHIEQRVVSEFIMRCQRDGLDVRQLCAEDLSLGVHATLKGMVNPENDQRAYQSFDGFREMYQVSRSDLRATGKRVSEQHVQSIIDAMAVTRSPRMAPAERSAMEGRIVRETLVAASAYRVAGMDPMRVIDIIKSNTDVGHLPIVKLMQASVEDEFAAAIARRRRPSAKSVASQHPEPPSPYE